MNFESLWWYLLFGGNILVWSRIVVAVVGFVVSGASLTFALFRR